MSFGGFDSGPVQEMRRGEILRIAELMRDGFLKPTDAKEKLNDQMISRAELLDLLEDSKFKSKLDATLGTQFSEFTGLLN